VRDRLRDAFVTATVVSITPERAIDSSDVDSMPFAEDDLVISRKNLERSLGSNRSRALIVRTLPNDESKLSRQYLKTIPPFFTTDAMEYIVESGIEHLLVDLPSIDRLFDEGRLSNHRVFWNVEQGEFETNENTRLSATITELIYVPDEVADGRYLLNLQIAPFASDATPSRPILFNVIEN
jgi:kynurenine formamidase